MIPSQIITGGQNNRRFIGRAIWFSQRVLPVATLLLLIAAAPLQGQENAAEKGEAEFFEKRIRPLLVERCQSCHSAAKGKTEGGLSLDSRDSWKKGGDSGSPIVPGKPDESPLIQAVRYTDGGLQMPPQEAGGKLPDSEIALLVEWVQRGAFDPRVGELRRGGKTEQELRAWWSFQPLKPTAVPAALPNAPTGNEMDRFLQVELEKAGLSNMPAADRRTLIRRATYDLTGLPPTSAEVDAFVADESPDAYPALIDRLLQSPHYGEQWGRHWLDLVRYADTAGENSDHPIADAWRYRNWVIDSFNRDMPYDQFIREQVAGDLLHAHDGAADYASGIVATGFLAIARRFDHDSDKHMHLTFEDAIDMIGKTCLGMSISCARCHDHKYDPISSKDYYALYGILNSTKFSFPGCEAKQQPRDLIPLLTPAEWARTIEPYDKQMAALDEQIKKSVAAQAAFADEFKTKSAGSMTTIATGEIADGGAQAIESTAAEKLGSLAVRAGQMFVLTIDPLGNYGADTTLIEWEIAEIDGQKRRWNLASDVTKDFLAGNPHADSLGNSAVWLFLDGRGSPSLLPEIARDLSGKSSLLAWRKGENPSVFVNSSDETVSVWTKLPPRSVFVHPAPDGAVAVGWVSPIDGQIAVTGRVVDAHPGGPTGVGWKLDLAAVDAREILGKMAAVNRQFAAQQQEKNDLIARAPLRETAYAVVDGTVGNAKQQMRGDPEKLGDEVPRRWLELFGGETVPSETGSGRLQLAQWLTARHNPLAARVAVNRLWQYHFGKGIVQTPSDFGTRGQTPSHPELLDWLAQRFVESGWSMKSMHRTIMLSAAYRQSAGDPADRAFEKGIAADPNNLLYWRFDRRRLSAEELRDTLLTASGQIDWIPGKSHPLPPSGSWSYSQHVPFAGVPETNKRSVYLMTLRNRRNLFMSLFDGADPNATTPLRQVTTVPTQSLYFLNDPFFHAQADKLARRVLTSPHDAARLAELYRIVLQRVPTDREKELAARFLAAYSAELNDVAEADRAPTAWGAWVRVLLSSNEFLFLD